MQREGYRVAFALACVAALLPVFPGRFDPAVHHHELLFGFVPVLVLGFMTVSLPRWLGRPLWPRRAIPGLLLVHAIALVCRSVGLPEGMVIQAVATVAFAGIVTANVLSTRAWRSLHPALLIVVHSGAGIAALIAAPAATRVGLAAVVMLCSEIGNRIAFALASAASETRSSVPVVRAPEALVWTERVTLGLALAVWAGEGASVALPLIAFGSGTIRLFLLRPWSLAWVPGVVAVVTGLAWTNVGFVFIALSSVDLVSSSVAIHAWGIGGLGLLSISIVASILRKKERRPFSRSLIAETAFVAVTLAAAFRIVAGVFADVSAPSAFAAQLFWVLAFASCLGLVLRGSIGSSSCRDQSA